MSRSLILSVVFIIALTFMVSCSGGDENLVAPTPTDRDTVATPTQGTTACFGLWQISIDPATGTGDIVQLRNADKIINVVGFMEPPPLTSMDLDWADMYIDFPNNHIDVGVILKHPIPDDVFTGFDVRGVCFGPVVENADGLTIIPGPEFFSGVPFGYLDGLLGAPDSFGNYEGLAGYKYFCEGLGEDEELYDFFSDTGNLADRGKFGGTANIQRNYSLDWNDVSYDILVFNYAIYANYDWPTGDTPWEVDDWDISAASSAEAFCCSVTELSNSLFFASGSGGGNLSLQIELWDWQGDISNVTIESDGVIAQVGYDVALGSMSTAYSYGFEFYAAPGTPTTIGDLDILITANDVKTFGECWFLDLLPTSNSLYGDEIYNCFIYTTNVIECAPPVPTGMTPSALMTYPGVYDDVAITGDYFTLAGGVTDVYVDDGTTEVHATDINVVDDQNLTCDFDILSGFTGADGDYDLVVITACEGRAVDMATLTDNLLYYADFGDGDGGATGGSPGYDYCSSTGRWEDYNCNSNYLNMECSKLWTTAFNVPASATDVHFRLRHSYNTENAWDACFAGWTPNNGATHYGDPCDEASGNYWRYESGQNYTYRYLYAIFYIGSSCIGCGDYQAGFNMFWSGTAGSLGTGTWSQFHCGSSANLIGMTNAKLQITTMTDSSVNWYRGHEVYELIVWYDPA